MTLKRPSRPLFYCLPPSDVATDRRSWGKTSELRRVSHILSILPRGQHRAEEELVETCAYIAKRMIASVEVKSPYGRLGEASRRLHISDTRRCHGP